MLRSLASSSVRAPRRARGFVSAVLLSKNWDKLTVNDLKKEARNLGLSPTGNKGTLISRLQEFEKSLSSVATAAPSSPDVHTPPQTPPVAATEGETPGLPLASDSPPPPYLNIVLPDASYDIEPEPPVQIPYTFAFVGTSTPTDAQTFPAQPSMPKMVVIGGEETYGGASPTHNLLDEMTIMSEHAPSEPTFTPGQGGLLDDMVEDLGLPSTKEMKKSIWKFFGV